MATIHVKAAVRALEAENARSLGAGYAWRERDCTSLVDALAAALGHEFTPDYAAFRALDEPRATALAIQRYGSLGETHQQILCDTGLWAEANGSPEDGDVASVEGRVDFGHCVYDPPRDTLQLTGIVQGGRFWSWQPVGLASVPMVGASVSHLTRDLVHNGGAGIETRGSRAVLQALSRERTEAAGAGYLWGERDCTSLIRALCRALGHPEPDYPRFRAMDEPRAALTALREFGTMGNTHQTLLAATGRWVAVNGSAPEDGDVASLAGTVDFGRNTYTPTHEAMHLTGIVSGGKCWVWQPGGLAGARLDDAEISHLTREAPWAGESQ